MMYEELNPRRSKKLRCIGEGVFIDNKWYEITSNPLKVLPQAVEDTCEGFKDWAFLYSYLTFYTAKLVRIGLPPVFLVEYKGYWCRTDNFHTGLGDMIGTIGKNNPGLVLKMLKKAKQKS